VIEGKIKKKHQVLTGENLTAAQRRTYIIVIGLLSTLLPFSVDLVLPAFPRIGQEFAASNSSVQFTFTGVTIGFAIGQLIAGPLADAIGRRRPMLILTALHLAGSLMCYLSPSIDLFFWSRMLQGIGGAGAAVLMGAVVRDLYTGGPMLTMMGRISLISTLAPIVAPIIGSQLITFLPWRGIFIFLIVYAGLVWLATYRFLIETLHTDDRRSSGVKTVMARFKYVLGDRIYVGLLIFSVLQIVALFGYLNTVSFLYQGTYGLTAAQFGLVFSTNSLFLYFGTQLGAKLGRKYPAQWVLIINGLLFGLAGVGLIFTGIAHSDLWLVEAMVMLMLFNFGSGIPLISALSLAQHPNEAGTAASLIGVLNFATTSALSGFYPLLGTTSSLGIGILIASNMLLGLMSLFFVMKPKTVPALQQ
jgi:DHA1 family bicyclomycin/chloramphenicol resistance-like MFS transporter